MTTNSEVRMTGKGVLAAAGYIALGMGAGVLLEAGRTLDDQYAGQLGRFIPSATVFPVILSFLLIALGLLAVFAARTRVVR